MLTLLSHIYRLILFIRKWLYQSSLFKTGRLPCPVICVGNLTTGGTGKTPAVIAITRILNNNVVILSRGYKRKSKAPVLVVSDGKSILTTPEDSGDEPYLMASTLKNVPVIVGGNRYKSGIYAASHTGSGIFILDDGYQHLQLHRDTNILLIDASNPFGNGHLLPKGILREPLNGISRADCVIVTRANEGGKDDIETVVRRHNPDAPVFYASYKAADITDTDGYSYGLNIINGKKVFIFSGIANPLSFRKSIEDIGGKVVGRISYPDHYWFKNDDLRKIMKEASDISAEAVLTTAKDAVRLHGLDLCDKTSDAMKIFILNVEMIIDNGFTGWLQKRMIKGFFE
ncbi:MAG: tetraacyldisaccharide 4'-kinase [Nitrospirae bacterium]|nr:tetraacyldisaccharide 4'-kinase [Nitrospirota bacterium]